MKVAIIDVGTSGCKTTLVDEIGVIKGYAIKGYDNIYTPILAEQNPVVWKDAAIGTLKDSLVGTDPNEIMAVGVISQRSTIIPINHEGIPVRNAILWLDKRTEDECNKLREALGESVVYKKTGLRIDHYFSAPKIMWMKTHEPKLYEKTHKFLSVHDYIVYTLIGRMITVPTQAARTMLFNIRGNYWDQDILDAANIEKEKLPDVASACETIGTIKREIAETVGLNKNTPVIMGGGDQHFTSLGLGLVEKGKIGVDIGSGSFVLSTVDKPLFDEKMRVLCTLSPEHNRWLIEAGTFTAGTILKWLTDTFGIPYESLNDSVDLQRNSNLMLLPYFAGSAAPNWNPLARATFFNISLSTSRGDVVKAIMESICFEVKKNLGIVSELVGNDPEEILVSGGVTNFSVFNQIMSDVIGKPVLKYNNLDTSALGCAMYVWTMLGRYTTLTEATSKMLGNFKRFNNNPEQTERYKQSLELNESLYAALDMGGLYQKIQASMR